MLICDICGRKIKQGESLLKFKNKLYCSDCAKSSQVQVEVKEFKKGFAGAKMASLIIGFLILLVLVLGGVMFWARKRIKN